MAIYRPTVHKRYNTATVYRAKARVIKGYPSTGSRGGGGGLGGLPPPPFRGFFLLLFCLSVYENSHGPGP